MKTFLHTSLLLLVMVIAGNAKAQTTVTINSATDSSLANCPLPVNRNIMVYGTTTGYNDVTDNMTVQVFWGDGSDTTFIADLLDGGGITDYVYVGIPHNYFMAGSFSPMVIMTGPDGNDDTLVCPSFTLSSSCVIIDGYLYIDMNSNCVYDAGDAPASGQATVMNGSGGLEGLAYADASGYYSISVASGTSTYTLSATNSYMTTTCPVSGSYTFTPSASASFDMGLACVATSSDYYIHHTGMCGYGPPGGTGVISFTAGIGGCTGVSGTATFTVTLDPLVTYVSMVTGPAPTSVSGGGSVLTWTMPLTASTSSGTGANISFITATSTSAVVMSTTCFDLAISGTGTDPVSTNNAEYTCLLIGGPYDPNNKEVMPAGIGTTGNVAPGTEFNYLINFQNCGTSEAINIYVMDTVDADLDMSTFQITGSSHTMNPVFTSGNIVRFDFPSIHLIDSVANEPLSHGWVTYRVKAKSGLPHGTTIENTAHIYFDYNPAVVTNTTLNTIDMTLNTQEIVLEQNKNIIYPNPANTNFTVQFEKPVTGVLHLVDASGKAVKQTQLTTASLVMISTQDLESGFYALTVPGVELKQNRIQVIK